ncbi:hypothetical protein GCM10008915_65380 [Bifidobacterium pullorum subsp. gallinarum]
MSYTRASKTLGVTMKPNANLKINCMCLKCGLPKEVQFKLSIKSDEADGRVDGIGVPLRVEFQ